MSRSRRAWWVPPARTSEYASRTRSAAARIASSRAYAASTYACSASISGSTRGVVTRTSGFGELSILVPTGRPKKVPIGLRCPTMSPPDALYFTPDEEANRLLAADPLALLLGMLLDQQVTMEAAFRAPLVLQQRLGGRLDARAIAGMAPEEIDAVFRERPALHRFPGSMAKRAQALCQYLVDHHDGRAEGIWDGVATGDELLARVKALPGFGADKARIFV